MMTEVERLRTAFMALEVEFDRVDGIASDLRGEVERLRTRVSVLGSALADASVALDEAGCQVAASDAHRAVVGDADSR